MNIARSGIGANENGARLVGLICEIRSARSIGNPGGAPIRPGGEDETALLACAAWGAASSLGPIVSLWRRNNARTSVGAKEDEMDFLNGYKSWIGLGLGALTVVLELSGLITPEQSSGGIAIAAIVLGGGIIHKIQKGQDLTKEIVQALKDGSNGILAILVAGLLLTVASPTQAADCNFSKGIDAKVIRFAWPPAMGVNLGFLDFEVGIQGMTRLCGNASVNIVGGACLIPKVGERMGGLCPQNAEPESPAETTVEGVNEGVPT